jgi:hypothetical protein
MIFPRSAVILATTHWVVAINCSGMHEAWDKRPTTPQKHVMSIKYSNAFLLTRIKVNAQQRVQCYFSFQLRTNGFLASFSRLPIYQP